VTKIVKLTESSDSYNSVNTMSSHKVEVLDVPVKSLSDKKNYRVIRLENGLTALLISDESYPFDKLDQEEKDLIGKESTVISDDEEEDGEEEEEEEEEDESSLVKMTKEKMMMKTWKMLVSRRSRLMSQA